VCVRVITCCCNLYIFVVFSYERDVFGAWIRKTLMRETEKCALENVSLNCAKFIKFFYTLYKNSIIRSTLYWHSLCVANGVVACPNLQMLGRAFSGSGERGANCSPECCQAYIHLTIFG